MDPVNHLHAKHGRDQSVPDYADQGRKSNRRGPGVAGAASLQALRNGWPPPPLVVKSTEPMFLTVIRTWAKLKGWTTTDVEATLFHKLGNKLRSRKP